LDKFLPQNQMPHECLRVIEVPAFRPNHHLEMIMDNDKSIALAFLMPG
jgi:hypothetical protein